MLVFFRLLWFVLRCVQQPHNHLKTQFPLHNQGNAKEIPRRLKKKSNGRWKVPLRERQVRRGRTRGRISRRCFYFNLFLCFFHVVMLLQPRAYHQYLKQPQSVSQSTTLNKPLATWLFRTSTPNFSSLSQTSGSKQMMMVIE